MSDFISEYMQYTGDSETPAFFNRWAAISGVGAMLGRQYYFPFIPSSLYPNLYLMFIGSPGTRKNTAINTMRSLLVDAGYGTIAADKTTKEKFLMDLAGIDLNGTEDGRQRGGNRKSMDELMDENIWGENNDVTKPPAEMFIIAPEFNDFLGNGNIEFISLLGNLWDYDGVYKSRIKNGKSIAIPNPTISIIGGNTPTGFSLAFPTEIFGQGFFSRLLLIYGVPNGRKIAFPVMRSPSEKDVLVKKLVEIKKKCIGESNVTDAAKTLLHKIYVGWKSVDDVRFESYSNRRFTHLLKLCLCISAARYSNNIDERTVVIANTILTHTENLMPKALGEFGKSKNSEVVQKIVTLLENTVLPMTPKDIYTHVRRDLEKMSQLSEMIANLVGADKIMSVKGLDGKTGFIAKRKVMKQDDSDILDWAILTEEERNMA